MGVSYVRRGRLEDLQTDNPYIAYSLSWVDRRWEHCDYELVAEQVQKQYEKANKRLQRGLPR